MDNYVYTREDLTTVRKHLAPGGMVAMGFVVHEKWIADRLNTLLTHVFGHRPLVYQTDRRAFDTVFFSPADLRDPAFYKETGMPVAADGTVPFARWVIRKKGVVEMGSMSCATWEIPSWWWSTILT